ncbi:MAG: bifunctional pyr operon transcriptional regulator/uracil phosphoribosyltransferase PyrR [Actinomycetaceae bacterium]|nr:bifunctional pyr operon transcriptional regulator/uracil phosphoribosyltransferase PyrR [Actinomycetaceae bacterium]
MYKKTTLMVQEDIERTLKRIAHEIVEKNQGVDDITLVGIQTRGVPLAGRLERLLEDISGKSIPTTSLDITFYRDDLAGQPTRFLHESTLRHEEVNGKKIILVDDVLFSGRTITASLEALKDYGRPASVQLAVLVDRGHRELPIRADYVGKNLPTSLQERVFVSLRESDGEDSVTIEQGALK